MSRSLDAGGVLENVRTHHYGAILAAIATGRGELLRLHHAGEIHKYVLRILERAPDAEEIRAHHLKASNNAA